MNIGVIMDRDVHTIDLESSIAEAASRMKANNSDCLVVRQCEKVVGIITEHDMVIGCLAEGHISWKCRVANHVHIQDETVSPYMNVERTATLMIDNDVDYLPVVDHGQVIGLVHIHDLIGILDSEMNNRMAGLVTVP